MSADMGWGSKKLWGVKETRDFRSAGQLASKTGWTWGRSWTVMVRSGKCFARTMASWPAEPPTYLPLAHLSRSRY
jgi:hypothetical protein